MPNNDREVFDHLTMQAESGQQERQIAFLSYALFAFEKREWIKLFKSKHDNREPSQDEIDGWISNVTESQFTTWRNEAVRFFVDAADAYFQDRLEIERENILRSAIVAEVKAASSPWKQMWIALLTSVLAPLLIGAAIVSVAAFDKNISASSIVERLTGRIKTAPIPEKPVAPSPR